MKAGSGVYDPIEIAREGMELGMNAVRLWRQRMTGIAFRNPDRGAEQRCAELQPHVQAYLDKVLSDEEGPAVVVVKEDESGFWSLVLREPSA